MRKLLLLALTLSLLGCDKNMIDDPPKDEPLSDSVSIQFSVTAFGFDSIKNEITLVDDSLRIKIQLPQGDTIINTKSVFLYGAKIHRDAHACITEDLGKCNECTIVIYRDSVGVSSKNYSLLEQASICYN